MDEFRCKVEVREVEGKPRLTGVLMNYGERATDRPELFERGALSWAEGGIILNRQHTRSAPILRFTPIEAEGRLSIDAEIPDTSAGRDALAEIKGGLFRGLSIEFRAVRQTIVGGVRKISEAVLTGAGLVDSGSYSGATVEARAAALAAAERDWREFIL